MSMNKLLFVVVILSAAAFANWNVRSGEYITDPYGSNAVMVGTNGGLKVFIGTGSSVVATSNVNGARLNADGSQITSNLAPINVNLVASNLAVNSVVSNSCPIGVSNTTPFYVNVTNIGTNVINGGKLAVTNIVQVSQSGNWSVIVSNAQSVSQGGTFYVITTNVLTTNRVYITDPASGYNMAIDDLGCITTLPHNHAKVHNGKLFNVSAAITSLSNAGVINLITYASNVTPHMRWIISTTGDCYMRLYRGIMMTNFTTSSTTWQNWNEPSTNVSRCAFYTNINFVTNYGTMTFGPIIFPGGANVGNPNNVIRGAGTKYSFPFISEMEKIIQSNTYYCIQISNVSGYAIGASISQDQYDDEVEGP